RGLRRQDRADAQIRRRKSHAADREGKDQRLRRRADDRLADSRASKPAQIRSLFTRERGVWRRAIGTRAGEADQTKLAEVGTRKRLGYYGNVGDMHDALGRRL